MKFIASFIESRYKTKPLICGNVLAVREFFFWSSYLPISSPDGHEFKLWTLNPVSPQFRCNFEKRLIIHENNHSKDTFIAIENI